jgi:hypothetical protein
MRVHNYYILNYIISVNREPLPHIAEFEAELLGNCDEIVQYISSKLGQNFRCGNK